LNRSYLRVVITSTSLRTRTGKTVNAALISALTIEGFTTAICVFDPLRKWLPRSARQLCEGDHE
jgi:hypothetical protein